MDTDMNNLDVLRAHYKSSSDVDTETGVEDVEDVEDVIEVPNVAAAAAAAATPVTATVAVTDLALTPGLPVAPLSITVLSAPASGSVSVPRDMLMEVLQTQQAQNQQILGQSQQLILLMQSQMQQSQTSGSSVCDGGQIGADYGGYGGRREPGPSYLCAPPAVNALAV